MKKLLFVSILAFALASCTKDNGGTDPNPEGKGTPSYLHVNFVSNVSSTRATAGDYEDGTLNNESEVKSVRLYFFDGQKNAKPIDDTKSYTTFGITDGGKDLPNVEKILGATVVIRTKNANDVPAYVVAILNPTPKIEEKNYSLAELQGVIATVPLSSGTNGFVMSNSVYHDGTDVVVATPITTDHYAATEEAAKAKPVTIYVERTVAKVRLDVSLTNNTYVHATAANTFDTQKTYTSGGVEKKIYVKFDGWDVTGVADTTYVLKKIENSWGTTAPFTGWNYSDYHRSFWAENPTGLKYGYKTYNTVTAAVKGFVSTPESTVHPTPANITYVRENAAGAADGTDAAVKTQVIIAGTLVDEDGETALEIAEYGGVKYYGAAGDAETNLKSVFASRISGIYKIEKDAENSKIKSTELSANDITFRVATAENDSTTVGRYYVYACLADANPNTELYYWSSSNEERAYNPEEGDALTVDFVNGKLENLGHAKIWKSGMTYYYFDIEHFGADGKGQYGVVRNHVYNATIKNLIGLGTPVYDPTQKIWPEKTVDDDIVISAEIRILSWRIVSQDVSLVW